MCENQGLKTNFTIFNATVQLGPVSNMGPVSPTTIGSCTNVTSFTKLLNKFPFTFKIFQPHFSNECSAASDNERRRKRMN